MTEQYDSVVARHYAAYRPPLHRLILERMMRPNESFPTGLDVGCGTGCSAVALTDYCDRVFGLDPSQAMLDAAQPHPRITYLCGSADDLGRVPVHAFEVVTFAGSLFYAKSDRLRNKLARACPPGTAVLVYDFEVLLGDVMAEIGVNCPPVASDYNHAVSFSDWAEYAVEAQGQDRVRLDVSETELAHVLLADSNRYDAFLARFPEGDPFGSLVRCLQLRPTSARLQADIYFARYRFSGS